MLFCDSYFEKKLIDFLINMDVKLCMYLKIFYYNKLRIYK